MSQATVWITGAAGLIGRQLVRLAPTLAGEVRVVGLTRDELELTDARAVAEAFRRDRPVLVIHCAGLTRSPVCEKEPAKAREQNVDVTRRLVDVCAEATLVFFSTDLVFDGSRGGYTESDPVNPLSVYAATKVEAEGIVLAGGRHVVVRTSLNHGVSRTGDRAFNEEMVRSAERGGRLRLFTDEFRCPIPAVATARAVWELTAPIRDGGPRSRPSGIFHVAGAERLSRWDIGRLLAERHAVLQGRLEPASSKEYQGAPRPPDTSLDCSRVRPWLKHPLPAYSEWLRSAEHSREE